MEKRKLLIRSRYLVYGAIFVLLYVLQCMPGFLEIGGVRPMLLIPAAVTLAMFEGEFGGGLYGALAGLLCGLSSPMLFGFDGMLLLCFCLASGLLVIYLLLLTLGKVNVWKILPMGLLGQAAIILWFKMFRSEKEENHE